MEFKQVGKYTIVEKIGAGAMGEVFRAHDPVLGRDVAIKVVLGKLSEDERARKRFLDEARAAAQLNHPNIITVYDFGEERGMAYMAMELLEGQDLRELLAQGRLSALEDKLSMMEQILDGLAFAHAKGVMHRDLKPGNVHVLPNGQVKIMDFGLARRMQDAAASGVVMGTPYYMAPEQAQGERATARSDIFSLGAMFYEMLAGRRPFTGATIPAVLYSVVHRDPEPLGRLVPELPTGIVAMVMRAVAKDPQARHADAGEMLRALRVAVSGGELAEDEAAFAALDPTPARPLGQPLSELETTSPDLRASLSEIEQYLADRVPPLMVADSVAALVGAPLDPAAAELLAWGERLQAAQPGLAPAELLYNALHKLSVIGELELVDNASLLAFLRPLGATVAQALPPGAERDRFRRVLSRLGEAEMVKSGPVERVVAGAAPAPLAPPLVATTPGLKRLSLLEQRLRREGGARGAAAEGARSRVVSQAIAAAAAEATSEKELEGHLRRLREMGIASGAEHVFRSLGQQLGDWAMPKDMAADTAELPPAHEVRAMQKIVALPEDPVEVARRYRHLVSAATEQFNEGNLGRAVQMFELARALAADRKIEAGLIEPIQKKGHEALDPARLRQYMDRPERAAQLQEVMAFFEQGLAAERLLDQLESEERRDRRRLLLDLLVVHGEKARALARARLEATLETQGNDFVRRNWIYLLRLVPRPQGEAPEGEIQAVARCAGPGRPAFLVKEAITHLGQTRHKQVTDALAALLTAWEAELARPELDDAAAEEATATLDRLAAALARQGGPRGWRALVRHGLSKREELGNPAARLAELGSQELSGAPDVVETLAALVRDGLPKGGVLSRLVSRKDHDLPALVAALAGTRTPAVRELLEQVREKLAGQEAGRAAARALEASPPAPLQPAPAVGQSGELDGYSLPALLHRLAETRATGTLSLLPREGGSAPATIGFVEGRLVAARYAHRAGESAIYQLFERPFAGEFAFDEKAPADATGQLPELGPLVREGIRRSRQLAATSALVPDDVPLEATGEAPGTVTDEPDYDLVVTLWQKATSGTTPRQVESELAADSFRILRPLAQWLEQGALRVSSPPSAPASPSAPGT
jgi:hypothetical protein